MAQIDLATITIEFNGTAEDLEDFCDAKMYPDIVPGKQVNAGKKINIIVPNSETKKDFFTRLVQEWVWNTVKSQRATMAGDIASKTELDKTVNF